MSIVHAASPTNNPDPATFADLEGYFGNILGLIIPFFGVAVFIMLLVGGFTFLTAGGDANKAEQAKKTLTFAVVGLIMVLCIWFILRLVESFTGVTVTQFIIPK